MKKKLDLQWKILIGIVAGFCLGILLNKLSTNESLTWIKNLELVFKYGGEIFVRLLRMSIIPLIFASVFMAVVNLGDIRTLGRIGRRTIIYYFATTALAVLVGIIFVNIIHPGRGIDKESLEKLNITVSIPEKVSKQGIGEKSSAIIITETLIGMIPKNPFKAMADGNVLQLIFFTLFIAVTAALVGKESEDFTKFVYGLDKIMHKVVLLIMEIAPYFIFLIVTSIFISLGFEALKALSKYALTVFLGLLFHAVVTLPLLVFIFAKRNPLKLFKAVSPAIMTAWSTASSAATLPITLDCTIKRAGIKEKVSNFVLPLGSTVNMDGTALYESVAVIFIAELMGVDLSLGAQFVIFLTATLAAVGAAAIPGAGLVTMGIVLTAVGLPLEGIGLILAIDRILDQFRTSVNVWGDTTAAAVIDKMEDE